MSDDEGKGVGSSAKRSRPVRFGSLAEQKAVERIKGVQGASDADAASTSAESTAANINVSTG